MKKDYTIISSKNYIQLQTALQKRTEILLAQGAQVDVQFSTA